MKKRTKTPSRKRTALRQLMALVLAVLLASALGMYGFLPVQAVRQLADIEDVEHPRIVHRFYDGRLPVTRFGLFHLVEGDRSVMVGLTGWHLLMGWYGHTYASIETWEDAALHAGFYIHTQDGETMAFFYGKIEDDSICRLTAELRAHPDEEDAVDQRIELTEDAIFERNGERYFIAPVEWEEDFPEWVRDTFLTGTDADGNVVQTVEATAVQWST